MWMYRHRTETDSHGKPKYWSQEFGWTWKEFADTFTDSEKESVALPAGGEWEACPV